MAGADGPAGEIQHIEHGWSDARDSYQNPTPSGPSRSGGWSDARDSHRVDQLQARRSAGRSARSEFVRSLMSSLSPGAAFGVEKYDRLDAERDEDPSIGFKMRKPGGHLAYDSEGANYKDYWGDGDLSDRAANRQRGKDDARRAAERRIDRLLNNSRIYQ